MTDTYDEICHQPDAWRRSIQETLTQWNAIAARLDDERPVRAVFVGSGTSLYLARSASQCFQEVTGIAATAVPSSEVFLSGASTVGSAPGLAFVISRSGTTSEAVLAARHLRDRYPHIVPVAVTCYRGTDLERATGRAIVLPHAAERSVVMTQSFTSMLIALQVVAALLARDSGVTAQLERLPAALADLFPAADVFARRLGDDDSLDMFIYLGLGPFNGLAEEATLKLKEMTQTSCEAYNPLEFRHGPISIVRRGTAALLLEGERERAYIESVERDLAGHDARLAVISPYASSVAVESLRLPDGFTDIARAALYLPPLQLLAYYRALALGLDPDHPRNLTQVVELGSQEPPSGVTRSP